MGWDSMMEFLRENRGLIIQVTRKYGFPDKDCVDEIEESYYEAIKTFDPSRTHRYKLTTHFTQILKSKLKGKLIARDREILFDDLFHGDNGNNGDSSTYDGDIPRIKRRPARVISVVPQDNSYSKIKIAVARMCENNRSKTRKVLLLLKYDRLDDAIREMPEFEAEIRELYVILLKRGRELK